MKYCGSVIGTLSRTEKVNRCVCYCADCQAFAHALKRPDEILDEAGGTDIVQVTQNDISFMIGIENLACMRLTENGLLRWYAACCNTPIGNTSSNFKIAVIGLVHNWLDRYRTFTERRVRPYPHACAHPICQRRHKTKVERIANRNLLGNRHDSPGTSQRQLQGVTILRPRIRYSHSHSKGAQQPGIERYKKCRITKPIKPTLRRR